MLDGSFRSGIFKGIIVEIDKKDYCEGWNPANELRF